MDQGHLCVLPLFLFTNGFSKITTLSTVICGFQFQCFSVSIAPSARLIVQKTHIHPRKHLSCAGTKKAGKENPHTEILLWGKKKPN